MKTNDKHYFSRAALIAGIAVAAWTPNSYACSDTPVLASICVMAVPFTYGNFNRQYVLATGQDLPINTYTALYSLIGTTYGTATQSTFKLPDLRGKFVIGADGVNYNTGATGGKSLIALSTAQLPQHWFTITALPVALNGVTVSTTLPTLTGSVAIASSTATGTVSDLKMNVVNVSGASNTGTPSGNYLGKASNALGYAYSTATPDATLNAGAISGGTVSVTVPASTSTVTLPGSTVAGTVGGTATVSGNTNTVGTGAMIDIRPPYIALTYYIAATNGLYPSRD